MERTFNEELAQEITSQTSCRGIYLVYNNASKKGYVGSSENVRKRRNNHLSSLRSGQHSSTHLQYAFNKYGEDAFKFYLLEQYDGEDILEREAAWICAYKANERTHGYNSRIYVENNLGFRHTDETKRKISRNRKAKGTGARNLSEETRRVMRENCIAQDLRQYVTEESEEYRKQRVREVLAGVPISEEHKESIGLRNRGEGNGQAKLREKDVREIKRLLSAGEFTQEKIAGMYGVSRRSISSIKTGHRWGHVAV